MNTARWLSPEEAARYVSRRVDELPRLVRRGLLPKPSLHFGPRSPRYDREALDALFTGRSATVSIDRVWQDAVNEIIGESREGRQKTIGGRHRQRIPLRAKG